MRDLLPKNMVSSVTAKEEDASKAKGELKVNRQRFSAQGYDISLLDDLKDRSDGEIMQGIETFRDAIKQLTSAQTVIRSLEGYGYSDEIAAIMGRIRDPSKANDVLKEAEELKERAFSEHNLKNVKKEQKPNEEVAPAPEQPSASEESSEPSMADIDFNADELDGLLDDLDGAFGEGPPGEDTPKEPTPPTGEGAADTTIIEKITGWADEGYSVEHLMAVVQEDQEKAVQDIATFEMGLTMLPELKERLDKVDRSGREDKAREIEEMLASPHRFEEISAALDEMESSTGEVKGEAPKEEEGDEDAPDLLEGAKEAYRQGDLETALARFQKVLENDPSNAKAKFMIRRISQKM